MTALSRSVMPTECLVVFVVDCSVPQRSVLGPLELEAYTKDIVEVIDKHDMKSHLYVEDTQLYTSCLPKDIDVIRLCLSRCTCDVALWCASVAVEHRED